VILTFPYRLQPGVDPSPGSPDEPVYRPKIPVRLRGPLGDDALTFALVDTGADETVVPLSLAGPLRVELGSKVHALYDAGGRPNPVRYGDVELTIGDGSNSCSWRARVAFQRGRRSSVLGRAGNLDRLTITFDGPKRRLVIVTPDAPPRPR
jgi:hypothetical protein